MAPVDTPTSRASSARLMRARAQSTWSVSPRVRFPMTSLKRTESPQSPRRGQDDPDDGALPGGRSDLEAPSSHLGTFSHGCEPEVLAGHVLPRVSSNEAHAVILHPELDPPLSIIVQRYRRPART